MPKSKKESHSQTSRSPPELPIRPDWPALHPIGTADDLSLRSLHQNQIVVVRNLWTSTLCKKFVSFLSTLPLTTTPGTPKRGNAVRVNDRYQIDDPAFSKSLWEDTALKELVNQAFVDGALLSTDEKLQLWGGELLGLNPNIRIYRYSKGQLFDQHYDESNNISFPSTDGEKEVPSKTTWTLLLYLTSSATGCIGGETVFYPEVLSKKSKAPPPSPIVVSLETGMALLHRHGKDCMLHEGREVTSGEKWVIRSDLCVKR